MRILFIGAGAVGGYFGGRLLLAGNEVFFTARGKNLETIEKNGLTVESIAGDFTTPLNIKEKFEEIKELDLIILSVKTIHTEKAIQSILPQLSENTIVISLQNGIESEASLKKVINPSAVIGGIAFIAAERYATGKIRHTGAGFITIGELDGSKSDRAIKISELFKNAGIECRITSDISKAKWEKLVWNVGFNALSAVTGMAVKELLEFEPTRNIVKSLMNEVVKVATAEGIEISQDIAGKHISNTEKLGRVIPSMLQDRLAGRVSEIEAINGVICRRGRMVGVETPYNETLRSTMLAIEGVYKRKG